MYAADSNWGDPTPFPAIPEAVSSFGAASSDNHLYIFSGHMGSAAGNSIDGLSPHFSRLDTSKSGSKWEDLPMHIPSQSPGLLSWNGKIYRVGGLSFKNKAGEELGNGDVGYTIPAEFNDSLFHKRGVLAAARDNNPAKASSGCQFYIVEGKRFTDEDLDKLIAGRLKGRAIPDSEREIYKTVGGAPHLDQGYTVYGEVVTGIDMVDRIAGVKKDERDRPLTNVPMTVTVLKKGECKELDKLLGL